MIRMISTMPIARFAMSHVLQETIIHAVSVRATWISPGSAAHCLTLSATLRQAPIRSATSLLSTSRTSSYSVRFRMS